MVAPPNGAERTFQHVDQHSGDCGTAQDFEQSARAIVEAFGVEESLAKAVRLLAGYRETFEMMLDEMDGNRDGRVGPDEFTCALVTLLDKASSARLRGVFAATDQGNDGVITRTEFAHLLSALGEPSRDVDAAFDALDCDHDGRITRDEYVAAWEDYLVSDNPDAAGVRVFAGL